MWLTVWKVFVVVAALALYASLWVPGADRYFGWERTRINAGWVSRLGFTLIFGAAALLVTVGPPAGSYRAAYLAVIIVGFVIAVFGFINDWLRDNA